MFDRLKKVFAKPETVVPDSEAALRRERSDALKVEGDAFLAAGDLPQATRCFRAAIELDPTQGGAYVPLGYALFEQGMTDDAIVQLKTAVTRQPGSPDAHYLLALAYRKQDRPKDAIRHFEAVLDIDPQVVEAYVQICQAQVQQGRMEAAAAIVDKGLALHPASAALNMLSGNLKLHAGKFEAAIASYGQALLLDPGSAEAHYNCGVAQRSVGRAEDALASFESALRSRPDYKAALVERATVLRELRRPEEALASFGRALEVDPDNPDLLNNCGLLQRELKHPGEALAAFDRALQSRPDFAEALSNRSLVLQESGLLEEALADCDQSLRLRDDLADVHANRGNILQELVRHEEALKSYARAQKLAPLAEDTFLNESLSRLVLGDLPAGWEKYEWRWQSHKAARPASRFAQPMWTGKESIEGKTVFFYAEQGLGDTIQFCRYARLVAERGAKVVLGVQEPLVPLLEGLEGVAQTVSMDEPPPLFDYHCPLLSLPRAFGTSLQSIPRGGAYIHTTGPRLAGRLATWQAKLGSRPHPKVGLVWSGNPSHQNDKNRSIPLANFVDIVSGGASFISLQNELREADAAVLKQRPDIEYVGPELVDFAATAALIAQLDLVVSVDTSVAHLAAAMGKPVWVLLPFNPDWRWLLGRDDSPWYESVRLFRQSRRGDWQDVLSKVAEQIRLLAK
ncbi:MAG: tetratricopeptide repeat protein [Caldimonas sp.]